MPSGWQKQNAGAVRSRFYNGGMRLLAYIWLVSAACAQTMPQFLARISEEAEVFRHVAPQVLSEETLSQRAPAARRFHPRLGTAATKPIAPRIETREIISEYSFGTLKDAPGSLHEFREVISVDGRRVSSAESARQSLALGLTSSDDKAKKRMLETYQHFGLDNAAVDFGPLLLLFTKRNIGNYHFTLGGPDRIGADPVRAISYRQTSGGEHMLVVAGHKAMRLPLEGRIYVRVPDGLPLRITMDASRKDGKHEFRDEATVDYTQSAQGFLAPVSVTHESYENGRLVSQENFRYAPFRRFGADAAIRFSGEPVK